MPGIKGIHGLHPNTQKNLLGNKPGNRTGIRAKRLQIRDALFSGHTITERLESGEWLEPLHLLMGWANDAKLATPMRLEAAKTAAQYLHRKAPMQVAVSNEAVSPLKDVSTEELLAMRAMLQEQGSAEIRRQSTELQLPRWVRDAGGTLDANNRPLSPANGN